MNKSNDALEKFFRYRLINVFYIVSMIMALLISIGLSVSSIPYKYINDDKSYIKCGNNVKYSLYEAQIYSSYKRFYWQENATNLDSQDIKIADKYCTDLMFTNLFSKEKIPNIKTIRNLLPAYADLSDMELANKIYNKFYYSYVSKEQFNNVFFANTSQKSSNFTLVTLFNIKLIYTESGSWALVISTLFFGVLGSYTLLNIFKETLIYLFLGRRFTWNWIKFIQKLWKP